MGEDGDAAEAEGAFDQFHVGLLSSVPGGGVLQVEVAAKEKIGLRCMRRGVGEVEEGGRALLGRCVQGCNSETERVGVGALRHVDL